MAYVNLLVTNPHNEARDVWVSCFTPILGLLEGDEIDTREFALEDGLTGVVFGQHMLVTGFCPLRGGERLALNLEFSPMKYLSRGGPDNFKVSSPLLRGFIAGKAFQLKAGDKLLSNASDCRIVTVSRFCTSNQLTWQIVQTEEAKASTYLRWRLTLRFRTGSPTYDFWLDTWFEHKAKDRFLAHDNIGVRFGDHWVTHFRSHKVTPAEIIAGMDTIITAGSEWADGQGTTVSGTATFIDETGSIEKIDAEQRAQGLWGHSANYLAWTTPDSLTTDPMRAADDLRHEASMIGTNLDYDPLADWFGRHGCLKNPGGTGDQPDFGMTKLSEIAVYGCPEMLAHIQESVQQETARPINFDGNWSDDTGTWLWQNRPFYRAPGNQCPNTIGRDFELASWDVPGGWYGYDRQHWSMNYLLFYALLSGSPWAIERCDYMARCWLAAHPLGTGNKTIDGWEASRAVGRSFLWAAHYLELPGCDNALASKVSLRAHARIQQIVADFKAQHPDPRAVEPLDVLFPDAPPVNHKPNLRTHWNPWQEAILCAGLYVWTTNGWLDPLTTSDVRDVIRRIGRSVVRQGVVVNDGWPEIGVSLEWRDGQAFDLKTMTEDEAAWAVQTGYRFWALPCVRAVRTISTNDEARYAAEWLYEVWGRIPQGSWSRNVRDFL